ncbi:MAG: hypothetical protein V3V30_04635 [Parvularculaceae bacterium]
MAKRVSKKRGRVKAKLILAIVLDLVDFTLGRMFGFGMLVDVVMVFVAYIMFGPLGLAQAWEMLEPTDQIDGFVPTFTILALIDQQ